MAPAPMMMISLGWEAMVRASLLPITVLPLKGNPGMSRVAQPVAIKIFAPSMVDLLPSVAVTSTLPAPAREAVPGM